MTPPIILALCSVGLAAFVYSRIRRAKLMALRRADAASRPLKVVSLEQLEADAKSYRKYQVQLVDVRLGKMENGRIWARAVTGPGPDDIHEHVSTFVELAAVEHLPALPRNSLIQVTGVLAGGFPKDTTILATQVAAQPAYLGVSAPLAQTAVSRPVPPPRQLPTTRASDEELKRAADGFFTVSQSAAGLTLRWRWLGRGLLGAVGYIVAGGGAMAYFAAQGHLFPPVAILGSFAVLFGLYRALTQLLNHTEVIVGAEFIEVKHGPLPWEDGGRERWADIVQLFVKLTIRSYGSSAKRTRDYDFTVNALTRDDRHVTLINGPLSAARCRALEATLERYLGIEDAPVVDA